MPNLDSGNEMEKPMEKIDNNDPVVELQDVSYTHVGKDAPTLRNVNLTIQRGTVNMIVGPSGSGKTTLCDIISGIIPHLYDGELTGNVLVDGLDTREHDVNHIARKVGKVFQDPEVMFSMLKVEDEIAFGPENLGFDLPAMKAAVDASLEYVDLVPLRNSLVWELSGGQVQRLGLGCILAMKTPVVIMDEPTANLDPLATRNVHSLIMRLRSEGTTVILVTKELDEFLAQADQVLVLDQGQIVLTGTPQEIIDDHGDFLAEELGVWLPEVCELGLGLRKDHLLVGQHIPLTVESALEALNQNHIQFLKEVPKEQVDLRPNANRVHGQGPVLISAENLRYRYPSGRQALKGISFEIHHGDLVAIVGRNGAGKSTLSKLLVGLLKPTDGDLNLFGKQAAEWKITDLSNKIALVFQNPEHQFLTDTVYDEIAYGYIANGVTDEDELDRSVERILDMLDLKDVVHDHPFALSAGKKRRLGVAAMLATSPEVLVVDEPTYGQDKAMTNSLMNLILQLRDSGITIIMITHSMRLVEEYVDHAIVMNEGLITFDGNTSDLFCQTEILEEASLTVTTLQELISDLCEIGKQVPEEARSVSDFIAAVSQPVAEG